MTDPGDPWTDFCNELIADTALWPTYDDEKHDETGAILPAVLLDTFCNLAARRAAQFHDCAELDDPKLIADEMVAIMHANASGHWKSAMRRDAVLHSLDGKLAFAALDSKTMREKHGHIVVIRPESMQLSPSLGYDVPMCANVGSGDPAASLQPIPNHPKKWRTKPNWNCKISQAFRPSIGEPLYFLYV